jgi:phosphohistidine phosphatase
MKTLLILRHAKSSWSNSALADSERPLNARGERDAPRMGELLRELQLVPDVIISSDAVRAHATAEAVAWAAGYTGEILLEHRLYLAGPGDITELLRTARVGKADTVMIVGHNPGLEELVAQLTGELHDLPTAALVQVLLPIHRWDELDAGTDGTLAGVWLPRDVD